MAIESPQLGLMQANRISHPMFKGFGVSMFISIAYAWSIVFGPVYGTSELLLVVASFLPMFILVNGAIALNYWRHRLGGVKKYAFGAAIALVLWSASTSSSSRSCSEGGLRERGGRNRP